MVSSMTNAIENKERRHDPVTIALHWATALLIFAMLALGWYMGTLPRGAGKSDMVNLHKSFGTVALACAASWIFWRCRKRAAKRGVPEAGWRARAAQLTHFLLYVTIAFVPLTAFLGSHFGSRGILLFGVQSGPFFRHNTELSQLLYKIHNASVWVLATLIALHMVGALSHRFLFKDDVLRRMLPGAG